MPSSTPSFQLPYPLPADPPDGAGQIEALAGRLEQVLAQAEANVALLGRIGSHATWTRGTIQTITQDQYASFSGAWMSANPAGAGFVGTNEGLAVPYEGVFLPMAQVKWEGDSDMSRVEFQLRQGTDLAMATTSTIQVKHEPRTGSEQVTIAGRASMMDPGDSVRLYVRFISGNDVRLSEARVHVAYLGDGLDVPAPFHAGGAQPAPASAPLPPLDPSQMPSP